MNGVNRFLLAVLLLLGVQAQAYQDDYISVSLLSEDSALQPGGTHWLGVQFKPADHWHVYWQNPGDSGQAPQIRWNLPQGVTVGEVHWPAPEQIPVPPLMTYGYHQVLLMVPVTLADDVAVGKPLSIGADVRWLVCEEVCIPGKAKLNLELPVADSRQKSSAVEHFIQARKQLPAANNLNASYQLQGNRVVVELFKDMTGNRQSPVIYPITQDLVSYAELPTLNQQGKRLVADFALNDYFSKTPSSFDFVIVFGPEAVYQVKASYLSQGE
ncbi:protein-disulfide reductase DsbD family protein [Porticoccus sp. W117]|uniref:protein-disulfide reductase DsbD domain-containing protein n=1 Tax=Porticoccus sp. W117 TaxID=3054777 RepID=UPI002596A7CB|nr:protein-disulfide reductase DsbD domain-containing protein [Porticoccus sp. W117]MDM3871775.1 protein-disulfide reductase DsbD family protein [Porticoccus sp. W117]